MIDWTSVGELRDEIGVDDFGEVVELFLEEVAEVMERLRQPNDLGRLEQDLHFLKGSALSLGFQAFSELCQEGERLANAGKSELVDLPKITQCYEDSRAVFLSELPQKYAA